MDAPDQVGPESVMDGPVAGQTGQTGQGPGAHTHMKVTLPAFLIARVTDMFFAFVNDLNLLRRKPLFQPFAYLCRYQHFF